MINWPNVTTEPQKSLQTVRYGEVSSLLLAPVQVAGDIRLKAEQHHHAEHPAAHGGRLSVKNHEKIKASLERVTVCIVFLLFHL